MSAPTTPKDVVMRLAKTPLWAATLLLGLIQSFDEEIQTAFADGAGALASDPLAEQRQMRGAVLL